MNKVAYNKGYDAGVKLACAAANVDPSEVIRSSAFSDKFLSDSFMQQQICKVATFILKKAGMENSFEHSLYNVMAKQASAGPLTEYTVERFIVPVIKSIYKEAKVAQEEADEQSAATIKQASAALIKTMGSVISSTPSLIQNALALSALGGAGIGSLAWALNRDSVTDSVESDEKHAQAMHYKRIANDLRKKLKAQGAANGAARDLIQETSGADYVL